MREYLPALKFNNTEVVFAKKLSEPGPSKIVIEVGTSSFELNFLSHIGAYFCE